MRFDTKIAVALADDLPVWQKLNVTAFLTSGLAAAHPALIGEPYGDADGVAYHALFRQPVLVLAGTRAALSRARARAHERGLKLAIYTEGMFATGHDAANREVVAAIPTAGLDLVGLSVWGDRKLVDKALDGLTLHP
ncbi:MAG TPA: DUF2000 family protein [Verrucomicrobiae bacterium]|jgi:hypothetical protein|nr:DUF2000 family protein [Verrucomicrobiae bacterium]